MSLARDPLENPDNREILDRGLLWAQRRSESAVLWGHDDPGDFSLVLSLIGHPQADSRFEEIRVILILASAALRLLSSCVAIGLASSCNFVTLVSVRK